MGREPERRQGLAAGANSADRALAAIVSEHGRMVYNVCLRILRTHHLAEEATQATFLVLVQKSQAVAGTPSLGGWLYRTATLAARKLAHQERERARHEKEAATMAGRQIDGDANDARWRELAHDLDGALERLPRREQEVLVLSYMERKTQAEVAAALGLPEGTVASRLSRGLARLRNYFARRGRTVTASALGSLLLAHASEAPLPESLLNSILAGSPVAAAGAAAGTSVKVNLLAEKVMNTMLWAKLKTATVLSAAAVIVGGTTSIGLHALWAQERPAETVPPVPAGASKTYFVDPAKGTADGDGSAARPFKSVDQALAQAKGGETISLASGEYPAVSITNKFPAYVTLKAQEKLKAVFTGGISLSGASYVRLEGLTFTWPKGQGGKNFVSVADCDHVEVLDFEMYDDPTKDKWDGHGANIRSSKNVLVKGGKIHHVFFGLSAWKSENIVFDGCDIGPWYNEDAIRFQDGCKRVMAQNCVIHNEGLFGHYRPGESKHGHIDAIQIVFGTEDLIIRNNVVHNVPQGISAFGDKATDTKHDISRKNWRVEGNLVYDVHIPHASISIRSVEGTVVANNTVPAGSIRVAGCKNLVFKNNIIAASDLKSEGLKESDYNLWLVKPEGAPLGKNDLVDVDPKFVNAPVFCTTTKWNNEGCTRTHLALAKAITGKIAVGDMVELFNSDYMPRDGILHKVTKADDNSIDVEPGLKVDPSPKLPGVQVYKWPAGTTNLKPDYRLRPDSPAVDSADGSVGRGQDMDGHAAFDAPDAPNKGTGEPPFLDRGAYEYTPAASAK